ncbi:ABC transporter permease [Paenibacillus sp. FSL R5-0490]|uniref:ABC transporter permease n=1 Tax=Paenibacillus sp. FSL R5-0490 TaxID=1920424 RepID=UPI0009FB5C6D|nr:ABC transporter permease [Paenibacillus sp. FSL R5-0490]
MLNIPKPNPGPIEPGQRKQLILPILNKDGNLTRLFFIMMFVFILMGSISPSTFLSLDSFISMAYQFPVFGILSIAMMITMVSGGIDLSIVSIANLTSILAAGIMVKFLPPDASLMTSILIIAGAVACSVIMGLLCGLVNGIAVSLIGIPPILVTLGTMQLFMGIAIVITKGQAIVGLPMLFSDIGNGSLGIIPFPLIMFIICIILAYILLNKRAFGLKLQLLGTNPVASKYSGISNSVVLLKAYACSGLFASIAGLLIIASTNSAKADFGTSYILQTILVAVMGGVNVKGGFGKISGVVMAVLTLQFLSTGLNALHVGNFFKDFIWGIALLLVMVINEVSNRFKEKKLVKQN